MVRVFVAVLLALALRAAVEHGQDAFAAWIVVLLLVCEALSYLPEAWRRARRPTRPRTEAGR